MSSRLISLAAVLGVTVAWLAMDDPTVRAESDPTDADRISQLETEVESLRQEVTELRMLLESLRPGGVETSVYQFTAPAPPARPYGVPDEALGGRYRPHGTINGLPYYVIPLNSGSNTAPRGIRR